MKAISLFGKMLTFSRIKINTDDFGEIEAELKNLLNNQSVSALPVVIDSRVKLDLADLVALFWSYGLQPIGVVEGALTKEAQALKLATFPADGKRMERITATSQPQETANVMPSSQEVVPNPIEPQAMSSIVHSQLLRSGQSLQHLGGDLIIMGGVNAGAEAITDSNLHIYGHGLGRLVAGATGDKDAHIFCQKFNPTLVSVAGTYCLRDAIPAEMLDKAVQVSYDEQKGLVFSLLTT